MEAIAGTIIPHPRGPFTRSVKDIDIAERVDEHLGFLRVDYRWTYRIFLFLMEFGGPFYKLRMKFFTRMNAKQRKEYVGAWHRTWWSPKRLIARFIESLININYYTVPEVANECGYTPSFKVPSSKERPQLEGLFGDPLEGEHEISVDAVVVGSGAGGAAAAKELAENGRSVVILEEGGMHYTDQYGRDAVEMTRRLYRNGGLLATFGWPNILIPLGCCVGGTTVINSGSCFRCPDHVLKRWEYDFGLSKWSPEKLRGYFEKVEKILHVEKPRSSAISRNTDVFRRGLDKLSLKGETIPRDAPKCDGSGVCCFGCPTGAKQSSDISFIPAAVEAGAKVYTHCRAERLVYDKGQARRIVATFIHPETKKKVGRLFVNAKVFVVACGTIHTPVFLKGSKLPDLSRSIGHNLTLHPAAKVVGLFDEEVKSWNGIPQGFHVDALEAEGIKLEQIFLPPAYIASSLMAPGDMHSDILANYNRLASFGLIISDTSHGRVFRLPGGRASVWYSINDYDFPKYLRGLAFLSRVFFAAGAKKVFPCIYKVPVITQEEGPDALYKKRIKPKDIDLQAFHPLGTCRMGANPREAALDPNGRLYGMDNVYVADGSIFPTSLGVNPQVTIMAAATRIAEHIHREQL